jgi:hypothetical protein
LKPSVFRVPLLAVGFTALACASVLAAQPAATGPWANAPAAPTGCYSSQDQYYEQNAAALDVVQNEHYKVNDGNAAIKQKFDDMQAADPMAMVQRMQQAMLDDPQNAQKYLEEMMQQGQATQTELPAALEREKQIEAEEKTLMKEYQAALNRAYGPGNARWTALKKKMGIAMDSMGPGELGVPDWAWQEWGVILKEWDRAYVANCATWFAAAGPLQGYLKRYKDFLVQERIPYYKKMVDEPWLKQYEMMDLSTAGYRTTTDYEAVELYLKAAYRIFGEREAHPRCGSSGCR